MAKQFGVSHVTIQKWQAREDVVDRSHRSHYPPDHVDAAPRRRGGDLLRTPLILPLDDLLMVTREFLSTAVSRSGLRRCLKLHGVSELKALLPVEAGATTPVKQLKTYDPGFVHVDVKHLPRMPDQTTPGSLFAAIDRATRWVHLEVHPSRTAKIARVFLSRLLQKATFL